MGRTKKIYSNNAVPAKPEKKQKLELKFIRLNKDVPEIIRATEHSAGFDICAYHENICDSKTVFKGGAPAMIGTGIKVEIPTGYFGMLALRSSLGKRGVVIPNGVGVIDSDYRGEVKFILSSVDSNVEIAHKERIGQLIILPLPEVECIEVSEITETKRGAGGFGSTGK